MTSLLGIVIFSLTKSAIMVKQTTRLRFQHLGIKIYHLDFVSIYAADKVNTYLVIFIGSTRPSFLSFELCLIM